MHDLINNILTIILLVVHTIQRLFLKKEEHYHIANDNTEKSQKLENEGGNTNEKRFTK